jgi:hypothetical protein
MGDGPEAEQEELDAMSPAEKFADLAMLMEVARALAGGEDADDVSIAPLWEAR